MKTIKRAVAFTAVLALPIIGMGLSASSTSYAATDITCTGDNTKCAKVGETTVFGEATISVEKEDAGTLQSR
jgi:hypothetical protein